MATESAGYVAGLDSPTILGPTFQAADGSDVMSSFRVGLFVGSLSSTSINRLLAKAWDGAIGTAIAQQHPRSLLSFCNSPQMNAPEACIQFTPGLIINEGEVTRPSTEEFLRNYMKELHAFIGRVYTVLPRPA